MSQAFHYLIGQFAALGLKVNTKKCSVWGPAAHLCQGMGETRVIPWVPSSGMTVLGTPVPYPGSWVYQEDFWQQRNDTDMKR